MLSTAAAFTDQGMPSDARKIRLGALAQWWSAVPIVLMINKETNMYYAEYIRVQCMTDSLNTTASIHEAAGKPDAYFEAKVRKRYVITVYTFPGGELPSEEVGLGLWSSIFNHADDWWDREDRDCWIGRYTSTKRLLIKHMEPVEELKYPNARSA